MIYVFIKNNEKYRLKRCAKVSTFSKELLSMESQSVSDRKQRVVLVKEK
jgi:hypothetical protein